VRKPTPVAVLAVLAFAGAVLTASSPPGWLGWCPPWALAAAGAGLAVLGTWLVTPWATRRRRRADQDQDALDELARHRGWSKRPRLLSEWIPWNCGCTRPSSFPQIKRRSGGQAPVSGWVTAPTSAGTDATDSTTAVNQTRGSRLSKVIAGNELVLGPEPCERHGPGRRNGVKHVPPETVEDPVVQRASSRFTGSAPTV
jgi:hypothetical protein